MSQPQKANKNVRRKGIPKVIRFEVFKRDSFKCQYCGANAPNVLLQIDHMIPVSKGGVNDITNLVTACSACNLGKGNKLLDDQSAILKRKAQLDELQERKEQLEMMTLWVKGLQALEEQSGVELENYLQTLTPNIGLNERGRQNIRKWLKQYSFDAIMKAMHTASIQYFEYDDAGKITLESFEVAFSKIPGICRVEQDAMRDPDLKDLYYIRGILRNRCSYINEHEAIEWLRAARSWDIPIPILQDIAKQTKSWSHFVNQISDTIQEWKKQSPQSE